MDNAITENNYLEIANLSAFLNGYFSNCTREIVLSERELAGLAMVSAMIEQRADELLNISPHPD